MTKQKFVIYKRLSKKKSTDNQHGFESQQIDIDIFLDGLDSQEVVGSFEEFISGTADVKPELEKAFELCRQTGATLLVSKVDRLSRRVVQVATYLEGKIEFRVATMPSANNFMIGLFSLLAEEERTAIALRVKRGLQAAKKKGVKLGASSPIYKANKLAGKHKAHVSKGNSVAAKQRVEPLRATLISAIQSHKVATKSSPTLRQLAETLTLMNTPLPSGKTGVWKAVQISRVMSKLSISV